MAKEKKYPLSTNVKKWVLDRIKSVADEKCDTNKSLATSMELERLYKFEDEIKNPVKNENY